MVEQEPCAEGRLQDQRFAAAGGRASRQTGVQSRGALCGDTTDGRHGAGRVLGESVCVLQCMCALLGGTAAGATRVRVSQRVAGSRHQRR